MEKEEKEMKTETLFQVDAALKKFKSAARKMKSISVSKYASIEIDLTKYASGEESLECKIYQAGIGHGIASTWEEAFENFNKKIREKIEAGYA